MIAQFNFAMSSIADVLPTMFLAAAAADSITLDLLVLMGAAALTALLLQRLGLAIIPGYFVAGALIGPSGFGFIAPGPVLDNVSHFAVILLMFGIGLHLDLSTLRRELAPMLTAGLGAVIGCILLIWPCAILLGLSPASALAIAMALSLSSTAVVLRILNDRRDLHRPHGRLSLAILIVQDIVVIAMLAAIPLLAQWSNPSDPTLAADPVAITSWSKLLSTGLLAIAVMGTMIAIGIWLLPRLVEEAARGGSHELLTILGLAIAVGAAYATQRLGFSAEFGAFLGGLMLSTNPFRHQILGRIAGLRDLFMAVFFTAIGLTLAWNTLLNDALLIIFAGTLLAILKTTAISASVWAIGTGPGTSIVIGLSLAQAGEFSLLVIARSRNYVVIDERTATLATAVIVVSLVLTPAAIALAHRLAPAAAKHLPRSPWMRHRRSRDVGSDSIRQAQHIDEKPSLAVVAGFGTIGKHVVESLRAASVRTVVVELNAFTVRSGIAQGRDVVFGDISDHEVLESAGIQDASVFVLTIPDDQAAINAVRTARAMSPDITIIARTHFPDSGTKAGQAGADYVIVDELATAHDIQNALRQVLGAQAVNETPEAHVPSKRK